MPNTLGIQAIPKRELARDADAADALAAARGEDRDQLQAHAQSQPPTQPRAVDRSIARLPSARTAFVGRTLRGPAGRPVLIESFSEFQQIFGGLWQPSPLGYALEHYFDNGGREALVVRIANGARAPTLALPTDADPLVLQGLHPGTREFLRASVDYDNIPNGDPDEFNLTVQRVSTQGTVRVECQETYRGLSVRPGAANHVARALEQSQMIRLAGTAVRCRPRRTLDPASGQATGYVHANSDGDDGAPLSDYDLIGSAVDGTGIFALDAADHFSFLVIPPISRERDLGIATLLVAARYCRQRQALLVVDPPHNWHTADDALANIRDWGFSSEDAFMYFPRILAHDKLRGRFETFAPGGAVAGMLARTDALAPSWAQKDPEEPVLRPGFKPSCIVTDDRRARLSAHGVNVLQSVRCAAPAMRAAHTLATTHAGTADWTQLATRRFALSVVNSIAVGTRWTGFAAAPKADAAATVKAKVQEFFDKLHEAGAFAERVPDESYFVFCEAGMRDAGAQRFAFVIGFAAARRGEHHCFRITHTPTRSEIQPVTVNRLTYQRYRPGEVQWVDRLADHLPS